MVTDRIVKMMQNGIIPWRKPWKGLKGAGTEDMAISYVTRRAYSLLNQWLLGEPGEYLTYNQIKELGGKIKKGAKARFVVFYTKVEFVKKNEETGEDEKHSYPLLKYYNVFHLNDTEGIPTKIGAEPQNDNIEMDVTADAVIMDYVAREVGLRFVNDQPSNRAYYSPSEDKVVVPMPGQFENISEYYSTAFHELTHSTMKASRCNRESDNANSFFGNESYSREELVAEMGAAMLCDITGIKDERAFSNSVAYLQSWIAALKKDIKMLVWAAARAEKAAKYILNIAA